MDKAIGSSRELVFVPSIFSLPGVNTLEGKIGPIASANGGSAHYITMPPDMYCPAHAHSTESIIYTAKGSWVLFADEKRHIMSEGSLFYMPPDIVTGYEIPFNDPATILISKFEGPMDPDGFISYLKSLAERLLQEQKDGVAYTLSDLPEDHPAKCFAKEVNPAKYE